MRPVERMGGKQTWLKVLLWGLFFLIGPAQGQEVVTSPPVDSDEGASQRREMEEGATESSPSSRPTRGMTLLYPARGERAYILGVTGLAAGLIVFQDPLAERWMHDSLLPPPGPLDVAVSDVLYRGEDAGKWLAGAPDFFGYYGAPGLAGIYYLSSALLNKDALGSEDGLELWALLEAFGTNVAFTQATKLAVMRVRPYAELERPGMLEEGDPDAYLSFFSGHTSASFCLASFVTRDVTDFLVQGPLKGSQAGKRVVVGRILPGLFFYGIAGVVGYSRIVDQKHYLSDVLVGMAVGTTVGNGVYARHFDLHGRARHLSSSVGLRLVPYPSGAGVTGWF